MKGWIVLLSLLFSAAAWAQGPPTWMQWKSKKAGSASSEPQAQASPKVIVGDAELARLAPNDHPMSVHDLKDGEILWKAEPTRDGGCPPAPNLIFAIPDGVNREKAVGRVVYAGAADPVFPCSIRVCDQQKGCGASPSGQ